MVPVTWAVPGNTARVRNKYVSGLQQREVCSVCSVQVGHCLIPFKVIYWRGHGHNVNDS